MVEIFHQIHWLFRPTVVRKYNHAKARCFRLESTFNWLDIFLNFLTSDSWPISIIICICIQKHNLLYRTFHEARKGGGHEIIEKVLVDWNAVFKRRGSYRIQPQQWILYLVYQDCWKLFTIIQLIITSNSSSIVFYCCVWFNFLCIRHYYYFPQSCPDRRI